MKVHYHNRQTKYYTRYQTAKRKAAQLARVAGYALAGFTVYAALYLALVATGAEY